MNEIMQDAGEAKEIPRAAMHVFEYHDHSFNVQGNIQGSNIAVGGGTISESSTAYQTSSELAEALRELTPLIDNVAETLRGQADTALQTLINAATDNAVAPEKLQQSIQTIVEASPKLTERLKGIGEKIGLSLASSAIFQALKWYFDIH